MITFPGTGANSAEAPQKAGFSILIPTWNNLAHLKLVVRSIREHSQLDHQIILHVNEGSDGTLEWVREQGIDHTFSKENVGICYAMNAAATLAQRDLLYYVNDDMYLLPGWDTELMQIVESLPDHAFFLSSTMIEPTDTGNACVIAPWDFGREVENFREEELLKTFREKSFADWSGATWPPNLVHREYWNLVGGYSVEFSPGMSSDPDFSMKLWKAGVRYFRGVGTSRAYHFQAKSTGKVTKNDGNTQFLHKWGITQSTFHKYYVRRGLAWEGPLGDPGPDADLARALRKSKWKRRLKS